MVKIICKISLLIFSLTPLIVEVCLFVFRIKRGNGELSDLQRIKNVQGCVNLLVIIAIIFNNNSFCYFSMIYKYRQTVH